jgi:hypothetical protein
VDFLDRVTMAKEEFEARRLEAIKTKLKKKQERFGKIDASKLSHRLTSYKVAGIMSPLEAKVREVFPDRDWDEEELDELANALNPLAGILLILIRPLLMHSLQKKIYDLTCGVRTAAFA